ncbi:hypothetical protein ACFL0P_04340 [Candidatus Omnitrophota bacterium]
MNTRLSRSLLILIFLISLPACDQATYSKQNLEESVIKLCKDEYGLDVKAKIVGSTLGVSIPVEGLVTSDLQLNRSAGEKIEDVALSIHRVIMSTDRPLKFYTLTARDMKTIGAEFTLTGFVYDVVRVRLLDISRGEYHKRILKDFKFNPVVSGEVKIKELFNILNQNYDSLKNLKSIFYPIYTIGKKGSQKMDIVEITSKEISAQEALFYVKTKERYVPLPGFEVYESIFPGEFDNEYLILINISMFPTPVKEIVSKYFYTEGEIRQRDLKETFDLYKDTGYLGIDGLPKKDLEVAWFLSQQVARRIRTDFAEDKRLKQNFTVKTSQGLMKNKIFQLKFSVSANKRSPKDDEIIFSKILKLVGRTFYRYDFKDFEGIELIDTKAGGKKVYLSRTDLEKFRRNRLKIRDLLSPEGTLP